jgi:hypothetical protein
MRRAFKVATVFTGAAACAAAFTPAAEAAPMTTAKTELITPDTAHHDCAVGPATTSAVFYWLPSAHHGPTCVGGDPDYDVNTSLGGNAFSKMCAGNNYGEFYVVGDSIPFHFIPGQVSDIYDLPVSVVFISKWYGDYKCAT